MRNGWVATFASLGLQPYHHGVETLLCSSVTDTGQPWSPYRCVLLCVFLLRQTFTHFSVVQRVFCSHLLHVARATSFSQQRADHRSIRRRASTKPTVQMRLLWGFGNSSLNLVKPGGCGHVVGCSSAAALSSGWGLAGSDGLRQCKNGQWSKLLIHQVLSLDYLKHYLDLESQQSTDLFSFEWYNFYHNCLFNVCCTRVVWNVLTLLFILKRSLVNPSLFPLLDYCSLF